MARYGSKKRILSAGVNALGALVIGAFGAMAQGVTTKPQFIGLWQNSGTGGRCEFFPQSVQISAVNETRATITFPGRTGFDATERPKRDSEMIGGLTGENEIETRWDKFLLLDDGTMTFTQIGPDGLDICTFKKAPGSR
jgi:hypothetical protein